MSSTCKMNENRINMASGSGDGNNDSADPDSIVSHLNAITVEVVSGISEQIEKLPVFEDSKELVQYYQDLVVDSVKDNINSRQSMLSAAEEKRKRLKEMESKQETLHVYDVERDRRALKYTQLLAQKQKLIDKIKNVKSQSSKVRATLDKANEQITNQKEKISAADKKLKSNLSRN